MNRSTSSGNLIDANALRSLLESAAARADCAILDCRFDLARPEWGEQAWAQGHIPGAHYAHLDRDLSGPRDERSGRHPLPDPEAFARSAGRWGISAGVRVVAYDQNNGMYAARAWWLLRWLGHREVVVLDGGIAAWTAAGGALTSDPPAPSSKHFEARPDRRMVVGALDVAAMLSAGKGGVVDARAADRYAGRNETIDPVAGHIPGAVNHPFSRNLAADGRFVDAAALRAAWLPTLAGRGPRDWIAMCGSGVSACHNLLALEEAGLGGARLYAGSWSEWIRDPTRPVATGAD